MTTPRSFHFQNAQIGTISTRSDGGIGFRISTGEIPAEHLALFFALKQQNIEVLITPLDREEGDEAIEVTSEAEEKTISQRIRAALYVLYKQKGNELEPFRDFYEHWQCKWLEHIKSKLEPEN
jgi:hypothetical protein